MIISVILLFLVFSISFLGVYLVRWWAPHHGLVDVPSERSSHERPIPRGGGIAIVMVTLGGIFFYGYNISDSSWYWSGFLAYAIGALTIAAISFMDDIHSLPNRIRFVSHGLGTIFAVCGFGYWYKISLPLLGQLHLGWIGVPITFLWIVGLTNAYNFMDGIDGIAGGQAIVAGLGWALLGWINGQNMVSVLGLIIAASSSGFLFHNWPPARIFMGDVGSAFLGYSLACLAVIGSKKDPVMALSGVLLVWPFVFDAIFTFFRRLKNKEKVFTAHRTHLYQRLVIIGYTHCFVTLLYIGLALIGLLLAFLFATGQDIAEWLVPFGLIVGASSLWLFVYWEERRRSFQPT